jgi:alpha-tubulin suppressor-like RCC1 family protein
MKGTRTVVCRFGGMATGLMALVACSSIVGDRETPEVSMLATRYVLTPAESSVVSFAVATVSGIQFGPRSGLTPVHDETGVWRVSDAAIAVVDGSAGRVRALSPGRTGIVVSLSGSSDSGTVFTVPESTAVHAQALRVDVGSQHACLEEATGSVYCWGSSERGQTGLGSERRFAFTLSPRHVAVAQPLRNIRVGFDHTCAVGADGGAFCWGDNLLKQVLPGGEERAYSLPARVAAPEVFQVVTAGGDHSCGLTVPAEVVCWGVRYSGVQRVSPIGRTFAALSSGYAHLCALTTEGEAFCAGANTAGQLGNGTTVASSTLAPVQSTRRFSQLSAGGSHTCAIASDSRAYCWGDGESGALGTGTEAFSPVPVAVALNLDVRHIDAGTTHTCAVVTTGEGYCWGNNLRGQLGIGPPMQPTPTASELKRLHPTAIGGSHRYESIAAGTLNSSCGVAIDSRVFCWGSNVAGVAGAGRLLLDGTFGLALFWDPTAVRLVRTP